MGRALAYLVMTVAGFLLLKSTGLLDGIFTRGNLKERLAFWDEMVERQVPVGTPRSEVEAMLSRRGIALECFDSNTSPLEKDCSGNDPESSGGTAAHPVVLELRYTFRDGRFQKFETINRVIR